jgi:tetrahydromethanopterin S-methyltransferase subunit G
MKQIKQKRITNRDLLETMEARLSKLDEKIDSKHESLFQTMTEGFSRVDKKYENLDQKMTAGFTRIYQKIDESQEELARMVAVGFEQTVTKDNLENVRQELSLNRARLSS